MNLRSDIEQKDLADLIRSGLLDLEQAIILLFGDVPALEKFVLENFAFVYPRGTSIMVMYKGLHEKMVGDHNRYAYVRTSYAQAGCLATAHFAAEYSLGPYMIYDEVGDDDRLSKETYEKFVMTLHDLWKRLDSEFREDHGVPSEGLPSHGTVESFEGYLRSRARTP